MPYQKGEQSKLGRGQRELPPGTRGEAVFLIDEQPLDLQNLRLPARDTTRLRRSTRRLPLNNKRSNGA